MADNSFTAEVSEMNTLGNGIVKRDGCVVFCIGACDKDTVTAHITENKKNFAIAAVDSVDKPSPFRTEPDCPSFDNCGGCTLRHITYEHETDIKKHSVESALRRGGLGEIGVSEMLTGSPVRYRNKAVFRFDENGGFGFSSEKSDSVVACADCLICPEIFLRIAGFCASRMGKALSYLFLRRNSDESEISVVLGIGDTDAAKKLSDDIMTEFPQVSGVMCGGGKHPEDAAGELTVLSGADHINEKFLGLSLSVSPSSFFQVNHDVAEKLCKKVAEYIPDGASGADLYCGTGVIGMSVASIKKDVLITGVEINSSAVADAKANAAANSLTNVGYFCQDSADFAKSIYGSLDFIIIDPPRAGCSDKMIKELLRLKAARIIYVSCDPGTLARDLKKLTEKMYRITDVTACDLFPRTRHVESIVLLEKN